jgi:hypothetical protein
LFRRRIVVVVVDGIGERAHKKLFSHKKTNSLFNGNKGCSDNTSIPTEDEHLQ